MMHTQQSSLRLLMAVLLVAAFAVACSQGSPTGNTQTQDTAAPTEQPQQPAQPTMPETTETPTPEVPTTPTETQTSGQTVEVTVTSKDWEFSPNVLTVKKGDRVIIHATSTEGDHGIAIQGYDQHVEFDEGQTGTLDFVADKPGTFTFYCNVPCGPGHRTMKGQFVVEE
jgi:heme/copper-type cytochrome/quinol oxidase subunit 2